MGWLPQGAIAICLPLVVQSYITLCSSLHSRSIAPYAPFQLFMDEIPEYIELLKEPPYSMKMEWYPPHWLFVQRHNCSSHVALLKAFGC